MYTHITHNVCLQHAAPRLGLVCLRCTCLHIPVHLCQMLSGLGLCCTTRRPMPRSSYRQCLVLAELCCGGLQCPGHTLKGCKCAVHSLLHALQVMIHSTCNTKGTSRHLQQQKQQQQQQQQQQQTDRCAATELYEFVSCERSVSLTGLLRKIYARFRMCSCSWL